MFTLFTLTVSILFIFYIGVLVFILSYWKGDNKANTPMKNQGVSIIIAARNEEQFIHDCIYSCLKQETQYPYELIIINDGSEDSTLSIIQSFNDKRLVLINNEEGRGKKTSLRTAIDIAKYDTLLFTDADCTPKSSWLQTMNSHFLTNELKLLSGPIEYIGADNLLSRFQYLDNINNMAMTNAGIKSQKFYSANGANIMYSKKVFLELGGYEGNHNLASGDDIFMMHKVADYDAQSIAFCNHQDAIVYTQPENSLSSLIQQRKRWATKTQGYSHTGIVVLQGIVFMFVLMIPIGVLLSLFLGIDYLFVSIASFVLKTIIDFFYLNRINHFFSVKNPFKAYLSSTIAYIAYILVAGYFAIFPSEYTWKGRKVK